MSIASNDTVDGPIEPASTDSATSSESAGGESPEAGASESETSKSPLSMARDVAFIVLVVAYIAGFTYYYQLMTDFGLPIVLADVPLYQFVVYSYTVFSTTQNLFGIALAAAAGATLYFILVELDRRFASGPVRIILQFLINVLGRPGSDGIVKADQELLTRKLLEIHAWGKDDEAIRSAVEHFVPLGPIGMTGKRARSLSVALLLAMKSFPLLHDSSFRLADFLALIDRRAYKPLLYVLAGVALVLTFYISARAADAQYDSLRTYGTPTTNIFGFSPGPREHRIRFVVKSEAAAMYSHDFKMANEALALQILNETKDSYQLLVVRPTKMGQPTISQLYARVFTIRKSDVVYYTSIAVDRVARSR